MKTSFDSIYNRSPLWLQNVIISIYGLKIYRQRYGKKYWEKRLEFENSDYSDFNRLQNDQLAKLKIFVNYAREYSPYYRKVLQDVDIESIRCIDQINKIPILEKETFRSNIEDIYTIEEKDAISSYTGGTTGKAIKVIFTRDDLQTRMAYLDAFKSRLGVEPFKSKKATFSGRQFTKSSGKKIFWRTNWIYRQRLYSTFDLTVETMPHYIRNLNKFKPDIINGFVSAIFELAKFIESQNIELKFVPKAIFTTSETLLSFHRELIERVFNAKVYNQYASAEGAPFITECIENNLHYNMDTGVIESYSTEFGDEILVTSFTTHGTPLIRYRIGDKVIFKEGKCPCGSVHPLVGAIEGRQVEYLLAKEGRKVSLSHLADVIKGLPNSIIKMQFIQDSLDKITVLIVPDKTKYDKKDEAMILTEMKFRFGEGTNIEIKYVEDILREKSGKYALIKNLIKK